MNNNKFLYFILIFLTGYFYVSGQDFLQAWSVKELAYANTAINESYLSKEEKNVFLILNLARIHPKLFNQIILKNYKGIKGYPNNFLKNKKYLHSLSAELSSITPLEPVYPNRQLWEYAYCHAQESGETGYVGHKRKACDEPLYYSECCSYGLSKAIDIVIQLLIDHNIANLAHRRIMLSSQNVLLGVSIQPHVLYGHNAVLDFSAEL